MIDQLRAVAGTAGRRARARPARRRAGRGARKVSLRASDDRVDVSAIARAQGGGGHRQAAGFSTTLPRDELVAFLRAEVARAARRDARSAAVRAVLGLRAGRVILLSTSRPASRSHDVVARVRRALGAAWRAASATPARSTRSRPGLLLVLVGRATRVAALPDGAAQALRGGRAVRRQLETGDPEGEIAADRTACRPAPLALPTGELRQRPPAYSAVKIGGERAYKRARRGEDVEMPERTVSVHRFEQLWRDGDRRAGCRSSARPGTYVRSLIADLGDAYCLELRRTAIGRSTSPTPIRSDRPARRRAGFLPAVGSAPKTRRAATPRALRSRAPPRGRAAPRRRRADRLGRAARRGAQAAS